MNLNFYIHKLSPNTGHKKAIELLIQKGANINAVESISKMTPLHMIAKFDLKNLRSIGWTEDDRLGNSILHLFHLF